MLARVRPSEDRDRPQFIPRAPAPRVAWGRPNHLSIPSGTAGGGWRAPRRHLMGRTYLIPAAAAALAILAALVFLEINGESLDGSRAGDGERTTTRAVAQDQVALAPTASATETRRRGTAGRDLLPGEPVAFRLTGTVHRAGGELFDGRFAIVTGAGDVLTPPLGGHFDVPLAEYPVSSVRVMAHGFEAVHLVPAFDATGVADLGTIQLASEERCTVTVVDATGQLVPDAVIHARLEDLVSRRAPSTTQIGRTGPEGNDSIDAIENAWVWAERVETGSLSRPLYVPRGVDELELVLDESPCVVGITVRAGPTGATSASLPLRLCSVARGTTVEVNLTVDSTEYVEVPRGAYTLMVDESPIQLLAPPILPGTEGPTVDLSGASAELTLLGSIVGGWPLEIVRSDNSPIRGIARVTTRYSVSYESEDSVETLRREIPVTWSDSALRGFLPHSDGFEADFIGDIELLVSSEAFASVSVPRPHATARGGQPIRIEVGPQPMEELDTLRIRGSGARPLRARARVATPTGPELLSQGLPRDRHVVPGSTIVPGQSVEVQVPGSRRWISAIATQHSTMPLGTLDLDLQDALGTITVRSVDDLLWSAVLLESIESGERLSSPGARRVAEGVFSAQFNDVPPGKYSVLVRRPEWALPLKVAEVTAAAGSHATIEVSPPGIETDRLTRVDLPPLPNGAGHFVLERWEHHGSGSWSMQGTHRRASTGDHSSIICPTEWLDGGSTLLSLVQAGVSPVPIGFVDPSGQAPSPTFGEYTTTGDEKWIRRVGPASDRETTPPTRSRVRFNRWIRATSAVLPRGDYLVSFGNKEPGNARVSVQ